MASRPHCAAHRIAIYLPRLREYSNNLVSQHPNASEPRPNRWQRRMFPV